MEFELNEDQQQIKRTIREFAEAELAPHVSEWDEAAHFPVELQPKFAELGIMGVLFPEEYGGAGMGYVEYATIIEELSRVDPSIGLAIAAHNSLGAGHIFIAGSEAQKQKYLAPLARGEHFAAWGLTEPSSGSDASSMRTTASRRAGGWLLNGSKNFITNAPVASVFTLMAVTDKSKGVKGISAFILEKGFKGLSVGSDVKFGSTAWKIVGVFTADDASFESEVWGDVDLMLPAFQRGGYQSVTVKLTDRSAFDSFQAAIASDPRLELKPQRERDYYADQSRTMTTLIRVFGTFVTSVIALVFAVPLSVGIALFMTEVAPAWVKRPAATAAASSRSRCSCSTAQ